MNDPIELMAGGLRWQVAAECRDALFGPDGLRLDEWLQGGQAKVVKHGPHRTVYRVVLPGLDVHIKHYRLMDMRAWLRELVRPAKAWMEFRRAQAVAARGIPTIEPLAVGRGRGPGDSFLITRSLAGAAALSTFLETMFPQLPLAEQAPVRQRLAAELAKFVARMHVSGIVHPDLHAGNLLVRRESDGSLRLFLIDLHATRLAGPLSERARYKNLVLLNRYFSVRASRSDRLRFWQAYSAHLTKCNEQQVWGRPPGLPNVAGLQATSAKELERRTWASNLRFWRQRDGRCLGTNRYFQKVRSPVALGHAVRGLDPATLAMLLADPDAPFSRPDVKLLKDSRSATVAEWAIPMDGVLRPVIYKRFRLTSWIDPLTALCRRPPALRSWINGHGLRERDLPTPRPLLVLHRQRLGLPREGYLLMEKVPDAVHLLAWVNGLAALPAPERRARLRAGIERVARLLRDLHARQLSHRDLKASNILVTLPGSGLPLDSEQTSLGGFANTVQARLSLIDLVGVQRYRTLPRSRKVQNLARLHVSFCQHPGLTRTDRLRFLRTYLQWGLVGKGGWKPWWQHIAQAAERKIARNRRSGRPLG